MIRSFEVSEERTTANAHSFADWKDFLCKGTTFKRSSMMFFPGRWVNSEVFEKLRIFPKCFWKDRHGPRNLFAIGALLEGKLETVLPVLRGSGLKAMGGRTFSAEGIRSRSPWEGWPADFFFIPALEFHTQPGGTLVQRNGFPGSDVDVDLLSNLTSEEVFETLLPLGLGDDQQSQPPPTAIARCDRPDYRGWSARVHSVLGELERDALKKVVLARVSTLDLLESAGAFTLLHRLDSANPHCYIFGISPSATAGTFLGASPERLFRREGRKVQTEAVAGTRGRSLDPTEDLRMERQLLESAKERHEQGIVVDCLSAAMKRLCGDNWGGEQPEVLKLSRLQHLRSLFAGKLCAGCTDEQLLDVLHPTPATCGFPVAAAGEFLHAQEPFDRGWYAGPVGIISEDEAEICVAIRSFHVRGSEVDVYAGAGIVEGCDPAREWAELDSKIAGILNLFSAS